MKKGFLVTTAATAILASGSLAVNADEVTSSNIDSEKTEVETGTEVKAVTSSDVEVAQAQSNQAQQDVEKQQEIADSAKEAVDNAEQAVATAESKVSEAQKVADEATPEAVEEAKSNVETATTTVSATENKVDTATNTVAQAQANVDNQTSVVSKAQSDVSEAQQDVNTKQAILDGTGASEVIAKAEQTQAQQESDQNSVNEASSALEVAKKADADRQTAINNATDNLSEATSNVTEKTTAVQTATAKATETSNTLTNATQAYTTAKNDYDGINTIVVTPDYIKYLNQEKNSTYGSAEYKEAVAKLKEINNENKALNSYKPNANDSQEQIDTNDLTEAQRQELTQFAEDLVNQVRKQFGTLPVKVTKQALEFADSVTDGYVADNWSWNDVATKGHDVKAITNSANSMGLDSGDNYYENMNSFYGASTTVSMATAKSLIYNSMKDFLFNGYEWLHAESITGLTNSDQEYLGVDVSSRGDVTSVHFLTVPTSTIKDLFDTTAINNPKTAESITETYNQAKTALDNATTANNQAKANLAMATTDLNLAKTTLSNAEQKLADAKAVKEQTPSAQQVLETAKANLAKSTAENAKAQQAVKELNADIQAKTKALNDAKDSLAQKQAVLSQETDKLNKLQSDLKTAQESLVKAQNELTNAKQNLTTAQENYEKLVNAPKKLEEAKQELLNAQVALSEARATNETAQEKLAEFKSIRDEKLANYQNLKAQYDAQVEAQRQQELEAKRQALLAQGEVATPVFDEKGNIVDYVAGKVSNTESTSVSYNQTTFSNESGLKTQSVVKPVSQSIQTLPDTGEKGNVFAVVFGLLMMFLGLGTTKKREVK